MTPRSLSTVAFPLGRRHERRSLKVDLGRSAAMEIVYCRNRTSYDLDPVNRDRAAAGLSWCRWGR